MDAVVFCSRTSLHVPRALMAVAALVAGTSGADPVPAPPAFQPGEISIGEPIALPFGGPASAGPPPAALPGDATPSATAAGAVPGNGWLGLAVAESSVPGRWRVEEVTAGGPAARAGIAVGDELRAVNGVTLASAEDVSQSLTAIAAGQDVRVAVARADQVSDVVLRAEPRPAARAQEPERFPARQPATRLPPATAAQPAAALPAAASAPPAAVAAAPTPMQAAGSPAAAPADPQWQAAPAREPVAVSEPRFGPQGVPSTPDLATTPAPTPTPLPAVAPRRTPPPAAASASTNAAFPRPASVPEPARLPALPPVPPAAGRTALGVRTVPIDEATQARFQLTEPSGAYVIGVVHDLPAAKAGVPPGSVIVALGDQPVRSPLELTRLVTGGPRDRPVTVHYVLPGGEAKRTAVVLEPLDVPLEQALTGDAPAAAGQAPQPGPVPRRAERVIDEGAIRAEIRGLRGRLERLERLLAPAARGDR